MLLLTSLVVTGCGHMSEKYQEHAFDGSKEAILIHIGTIIIWGTGKELYNIITDEDKEDEDEETTVR